MNGIEACFAGRLGRDAELRMVKSGTMPFLSFTAAVDQQHQTEDSPPTWVRVALFGERAEQMAVKGTKVYVERKLEASIWQPENGPAAAQPQCHRDHGAAARPNRAAAPQGDQECRAWAADLGPQSRCRSSRCCWRCRARCGRDTTS